MSTTETNLFLQGNYGPVDVETTAVDLEVDGALPPALSGTLLRDGPNPAGPRDANHHWFLGDGMIHGVNLERGRARWYRNRWVRTPSLADERGLPAAPRSPVDATIGGSGGVNVIGHAGRILALGEVGLPYLMSPELDTVEQYDFSGRLATNMTAHPHLDAETGELYFFGYDFGPTNLRYHVADSHGALIRTEEIDTPGPTMMHDFGLTSSRAIFMDLPVVFSFERLGEGTMPFVWDESYGARLGVMPREGGNDDVQWIEMDPCYVFHVLNAFDDGDRVVMDVVRHPTMFASSQVGPNEPSLPALHRWTIDPATATVKDEQLDDQGIELPRLDERLVGQPHRYGYAMQLTGENGFDSGGLVQYDLDERTSTVHEVGDGRMASEGVFVPGGPGENEGWILAVVYDRATDRSDVIVVDATDFAAPPVATIHLPVRVPFGFHGSWIPSDR
jgi:carotenoid cleavage dioxygenase